MTKVKVQFLRNNIEQRTAQSSTTPRASEKTIFCVKAGYIFNGNKGGIYIYMNNVDSKWTMR